MISWWNRIGGRVNLLDWRGRDTWRREENFFRRECGLANNRIGAIRENARRNESIWWRRERLARGVKVFVGVVYYTPETITVQFLFFSVNVHTHIGIVHFFLFIKPTHHLHDFFSMWSGTREVVDGWNQL